MILPAGDPGRDVGLVYRDDALAAGPATHVLIVGVGAYRSPRFKTALTTTTVSARALADWFVEPGPAGFGNPACPLGSVALLLSEPVAGDGEARSAYAGGRVPRADLAATKAALRAWVERINSHKDNLAILYVASHGESFLGRTAFLLEDYGIDPLDATAGMSEVEQLAGALENAVPIRQLLLFDCCRVPTDMRLPLTGGFGTPLVNLSQRLDDHGERRKQCRIAATGLGDVAIGRTDRTTHFMEALITALRGVASEQTATGWLVHPAGLVDKIDRLMSLQRRAGENAQAPDSQMSGRFEINFPGDPSDVAVYVSLDDPADWPDSEIVVAADPGPATTILGREGDAPFGLIRVPLAAEISVTARCAGADRGTKTIRAFAPAIFLEIGRTPPPPPVVVGRLDPGRSVGASAQILLRLDGPLQIEAGAIATVVRRDDPARNPKEVSVPIGGRAVVEVSPGAHLVTLRTPDGRLEARDVAAGRDEILEVTFALQTSPHEWLASAAMTGAIRTLPFAPGIGGVVTPAAPAPPSPSPSKGAGGMASIGVIAMAPIRRAIKTLTKTFGVVLSDTMLEGTFSDIPPEDILFPAPIPPPRPNLPPHSDVSCHVDVSLARRVVPDPMVDTAEAEADERLVRLDFVEQASTRFGRHQETVLARPLFALVEAGDRRELAVIASLGLSGKGTRGGWTPYILADRFAPIDEALSRVVVEDRVWGALLGFLAARDMDAGGRLIDDALGQEAVQAMREKAGNPLAALAGALVAVATARPDLEQRWDPWLMNLSNWFPGIPDGPIILGRRRLLRARTAGEVAEARRWLFEGFDRGAPVYSLSADWLARGLESLPGEDAELARRRSEARRLAGRVDPRQAFTVIRLDDQGR